MTKRASFRQDTPEKEELYRKLRAQLALQGQSGESWFWARVRETVGTAKIVEDIQKGPTFPADLDLSGVGSTVSDEPLSEPTDTKTIKGKDPVGSAKKRVESLKGKSKKNISSDDQCKKCGQMKVAGKCGCK